MEHQPHDPRHYRVRIVDNELDLLLAVLPAICIDGPKAVGKTATASRRAGTTVALDDPAVREVVAADPGRALRADRPVLVDEWQRYPPVWDAVRRAVDADPTAGTFLLTGSASPQAPSTHSGAGRIVSLRMRPQTLPERGLTQPSVSLADLLFGDGYRTGAAIDGHCSFSLEDYTRAIVTGGFPGMQAGSERAQRTLLASYVDRIVDRDFPGAGRSPRNPELLRRWLRAYAAATATTTSYERLRDATSAGQSDKPARSTTQPYQETLQRIWIADPLPGWTTSANQLARLTRAPKHHLADPALAAALTGMTVSRLIVGSDPDTAVPRDGSFLGALFESLVALHVRVFAQSSEATAAHLRTRAGDREVDFIISGPDRSVLAVECKLARTVDSTDAKHLHWLARQLGEELRDAMIVTTGDQAYRRSDGIAVVPLALLGP